MNYLRRIVDWIVSFESGRQFRKGVSILVKLFGVFVLIWAVVGGIVVSNAVIQMADYFSAGKFVLLTIGAILSFVFNVVFGIVFVMLCWNRANKISGLDQESHFTLIPIMIIQIRLFGEGAFISSIGTGVQILVASIFGSKIGLWRELSYNLGIGIGAGFITGVVSLVVSVLIGASLLIFAYFIAEQIHLLLDMASNLKKIETKLSVEEAASSP